MLIAYPLNFLKNDKYFGENFQSEFCLYWQMPLLGSTLKFLHNKDI